MLHFEGVNENFRPFIGVDQANLVLILKDTKADGFYDFQSRISNKGYSEPLMHTLFPAKVLLKVISMLFKILSTHGESFCFCFHGISCSNISSSLSS